MACMLMSLASCTPSRPRIHAELEAAIRTDDTNALAILLVATTNLNLAIKHRSNPVRWETPLHVAAEHGSMGCLQLLLAKGADADRTNFNGNSVLNYAVICRRSFGSTNGYETALRSLLDAGANVNARDPIGGTVLQLASQLGDADGVRVFLNAGAEVNSRDDSGGTALHYAENVEVARLLLEAGADPAIQTHSGTTAIDSAMRLGRKDVADAISGALQRELE